MVATKSQMPPPAPRKPRNKVVRKLHRRDAIAGLVKHPSDLFKKSVRFSIRDTITIFDHDSAAASPSTHATVVSMAREQELLTGALQDPQSVYKDSLVSTANEIDFERTFNRMLREQGYNGRGRNCAAALAMGTVRKLARNAEVAISMSESLLDLFKEEKLEVELISELADLCFIHKDAMTVAEQAAVRQYVCGTV